LVCVDTNIYVICLCYRQKEAEFIKSFVDEIYSDSSLIDGLIVMGSLVEEMNQRMFAFLRHAGGVVGVFLWKDNVF
jgi:hypothetical protein